MKRARHGVFTFFRQWLKNPLRTAAVMPSSSELAYAMIAELLCQCCSFTKNSAEPCANILAIQ